MAIVLSQQNGVMGGEQGNTERTWLDVVKAAANVEERDLADRDTLKYATVIEPSWMGSCSLANESTSSGTLNDLISRIGEGLSTDYAVLRSREIEEQKLVNSLDESLSRAGSLTKENFLGLLRSHLLRVRRHPSLITSEINQVAEVHNNGTSNDTDEKSILNILKKTCRSLGQRLISVILHCSTVLQLWTIVQTLLERRVVDTFSCEKLVQSAIEEDQPRILCLCVTNVPDLTPRDILSILSYFLDSFYDTPKSFHIVRRDWRRVALNEMDRFSKNRNEKLDNSEVDTHGGSESAAIGLAMAIDGFSSPELCIHFLLSSEQDEAVLSSVLSRLSTSQLVDLLHYLCKWMRRYSSQLVNYPTPKSRQVPALFQVLCWAGIILENHFSKFVFSSDFHEVIKLMENIVQPLVELGGSLSTIVGIVQHLQGRFSSPVEKQVTVKTTDYVIELLDMS